MPTFIMGMEVSKPVDSQQLFLFKKIVADNEMVQGYLICLCRGSKENIIGYADISIAKKTRTAHLHYLHINSGERQKSYGSILLKAVLHDASNQLCNYIKWEAAPFDLRTDESKEEIFPKLVNFYTQHGAIPDAKSTYSNGMMYRFNEAQHVAEPQFAGKPIIMSRL